MDQDSGWRNKVTMAQDSLLTSYLSSVDPWKILPHPVALQMELEGTGLGWIQYV